MIGHGELSSLDLDQVFEMVNARATELLQSISAHGLSLEETEYRRGQIAALVWVSQIPAMQEEEKAMQEVEWLK